MVWQAKAAIALAVVAFISVVNWWAIHTLMQAGANECRIEVNKAREVAQHDADKINARNDRRVGDATAVRDTELLALRGLLSDRAISVMRLRVESPTAASVPEVSDTPAGSLTLPGGDIYEGSVCETPAGILYNAQRADELNAQYRLLYDSWPSEQ